MKSNLTAVTTIEFESRLARRMKLSMQTRDKGLMAYQAYFHILLKPYEKPQDTRYTKEYR